MRARRLSFQALNQRLLLASDFSGPDSVDVDGDGTVTGADANLVYQTLRSGSAPVSNPGYDESLDVNGDGNITALDLLRIINRIRADDVAAAVNGEAMPEISIADAQVVEGNGGTTALSFQLNLSQVPDAEITIDVAATNGSATGLQVERIASGLSRPIFVTQAPGEPDKLFIVQQGGVIRVLDLTTGNLNATPLVTIPNLASGNEQGLLGLAFHPQYETNRLFYVYLTVANQDTVVRQYQANVGSATADPATAQTIITYDQPYSNHNGGWIGFGPDNYLYVASGDGGSGNDPQNNAQDIVNNLLGKMLRIDVNGDDFPADPLRNYAIPDDNPFVGVTGDDEIWAYGLRNPWRSSFDRETGDLYIADVGQNRYEEINVQPAASDGGENYGWRPREGTIATPGSVGGPKPPGAIDPIYEYLHASLPNGGYSVTGGYVYRGPIEELQGHYFFADYVTSRVWSLRYNNDAPAEFDGTNFEDFTDWTDLLRPNAGTVSRVSSFGEDSEGNLYIVDLGGEVFRLTEGADFSAPTTLTIPVGQANPTLVIDVVGDRLAEANETLTVTLSNPSAGSILDGQATGTIINDDGPRVREVEVNRGEIQRSIVDEVSLTFDSQVVIDESGGPAFEFQNLNTNLVAGHTKNVSTVDGKTVVTFGFVVGDSVDARGTHPPTLADGTYQFTINAARVTVEGIPLDGDDDGVPGGNHVVVDNLYRRYGDQNLNMVVDLLDFAEFRGTFGLLPNDPNYRGFFDENGDNVVGLFDFAAFRANFGT